MLTRLRLLALMVAAATAVGIGGHACRSNSRVDPPNIVVITLDTTRADHLGCYGYFRDTSPVIDRLAARSIVFERCIVPMATTLPTHTSIFTGTYPIEHGVLANLTHGGTRFTPSPDLRSLPQVASEAGYQTAAFVSAAPLKRGSGMEIGFDVFDQPSTSRREAAATNKKIFEWLPSLDERPYLLWVHYYDPHWPYRSGSAYRTDEALETYLAERRVSDTTPRPLAGLIEDSRAITNSYDGEIRTMDSELGKLLERLEGLPGWDNTVVLLIGDHGEGLGQHGHAAHGGTWNEQLWAPMMIRVPGEPARRVPQVVSAVDALPTLLGLIDAPELDVLLSQASGRDVLAADFEPAPVFGQDTGRLVDEPNYRYSVTTRDWKYFSVRVGEDEVREELYDLTTDPHELHDLLAGADQSAGALRALRGFLIDQIRTQERRALELRRDEPTELDPELIEQLRSLGYVE